MNKTKNFEQTNNILSADRISLTFKSFEKSSPKMRPTFSRDGPPYIRSNSPARVVYPNGFVKTLSIFIIFILFCGWSVEGVRKGGPWTGLEAVLGPSP